MQAAAIAGLIRDVLIHFDLFAAAPPVILAPLKDTIVKSGSTLELTAAINATAEPVNAYWQRDNKPVDTKAKGITVSSANGQCTLKIDSCSPAAAGQYSLTVTNPKGSVSSSAKIIVGTFPCNTSCIP